MMNFKNGSQKKLLIHNLHQYDPLYAQGSMEKAVPTLAYSQLQIPHT